MALQASSALKNACDKGHNWFTTKKNNFKTVKFGYNQIQPKMLPKGLTMFNQEHCQKFDECEDRELFLRGCARAHSIDVIDDKTRAKIIGLEEEAQRLNQIEGNENGANLNVNERGSKDRRKSEALLTTPGMELRVMTPNRYKYKKSKNCEKIIVKSSDAETMKILPSVLLTYKEEFIRIRVSADDEKEEDFKNVDQQSASERNIFKFKERSNSMKSIDI